LEQSAGHALDAIARRRAPGGKLSHWAAARLGPTPSIGADDWIVAAMERPMNTAKKAEMPAMGGMPTMMPMMMNPMMMGGMMNPMMMGGMMPMMMCRMSCEMTKDGMMMKMMAPEGMSQDMFMDMCARMMPMMMSMPTMMACGGMMMLCMPMKA
jgi:hypothetical protein